MRHLQLGCILAFALVLLMGPTMATAQGALCDRGQVELWSTDVSVSEQAWEKDVALLACSHRTERELYQLTNTCVESDGRLQTTPSLDGTCLEQDCRYFGYPVRSWICSRHGRAACCQ